MRLATLLLVLSFGLTAAAQPCDRATAEATLDGAGVRAKLFTSGALFWNGGDHVYEVPAGSGRQSIFSAALWLSGTVDGEARFSGTDYGPYEYWPGPLGPGGAPPTPASCAEHDRIWSVTLADVAAYNETGVATDDLREWPAHLGAPVVDGNGDADDYDLAGGDRPNVYGGHVLWWIMNDLGGPHDWSRVPGLGVEVRVTASVATEGVAQQFEEGTLLADLVRYATYYRFDVLYRGTEAVEDVHVGIFADADLGFFSDDYVGTAPEARMVYTYNGDDIDEGSGGYGAQPPAVGLVAGRPPEGVTTRGSVLFKSATQATAVAAVDGPSAANALRGLVRDGSQRWTFGGLGSDSGNPPTDWTFPTLPPDYWSERDLDGNGTSNLPADRRMLISQGPYTLEPGEGFTFELAIPWARAEAGGALGSVRKLVRFIGPSADALPVAAPTDLATIFPSDPRVMTEPESTPRGDPPAFALASTPWPNPARETTVIRYDAPAAGTVRLTIYDALGREVAVALDGPTTADYHQVRVNVRGLAPGLYMYRLVANGRSLPTVGRFVVAR
ncbi:MAG: T9SS type A sorting domain-containing protein [Bacteroidota bacterium]